MNKFLIKLFFVAFIFISASAYAQNTPYSETEKTIALWRMQKRLSACRINIAHSNPTTGSDCSGFISHVFGKFGVEIPRASAAHMSSRKLRPNLSDSLTD